MLVWGRKFDQLKGVTFGTEVKLFRCLQGRLFYTPNAVAPAVRKHALPSGKQYCATCMAAHMKSSFLCLPGSSGEVQTASRLLALLLHYL